MDYEFFFSYTRGNNNDYLKKFFEDLSEEVRQQLGYNKDKVVGFFDQSEIELGEKWDEKIAQALQSSKVMVSIYSPGYFKSTYCGKEWRVFQDRRTLFMNDQRLPTLPPLIMPVLWMHPIPTDLNEEVSSLQYYKGDADHIYNKKGLKYVLQKLAQHNSDYIDFVRELATAVRETADDFRHIVNRPIPELNNIEQLFPRAFTTPPQIVEKKYVDHHKHVRFVFVAGDPREFAGQRSIEPYLETGGRDWRPFSNVGRIGPFVQHIVSSEELDFLSDELVLNENLLEELEIAYRERKVVIFIIDGWSLTWKQEFRQLLGQFDRMQFLPNCSVMIPWNTEDADSVRQKDLVDAHILTTFYQRINWLKNPIFYRDKILSRAQFETTLKEILIGVRAEMHKQSQVLDSIQNPIAKPVISNLLK